MNWFAQATKGATSGLFEGIGSLAKDLRSAITGEMDPETAAKIEEKILELEAAANNAQIMVNMEESKHKSIFVAGWRPAIGWVGALALLYQFIIHPLVVWGCAIWFPDITPPVLDTEQLFTLLAGMLGFGGFRTFEKLKGVDTKKIVK